MQAYTSMDEEPGTSDRVTDTEPWDGDGDCGEAEDPCQVIIRMVHSGHVPTQAVAREWFRKTIEGIPAMTSTSAFVAGLFALMDKGAACENEEDWAAVVQGFLSLLDTSGVLPPLWREALKSEGAGNGGRVEVGTEEGVALGPSPYTMECFWQGTQLCEKDNHRAAIRQFERVLTLLQGDPSAGTELLRARVLVSLAHSCLALSVLSRTCECLRQARDIYDQVGSALVEAGMLYVANTLIRPHRSHTNRTLVKVLQQVPGDDAREEIVDILQTEIKDAEEVGFGRGLPLGLEPKLGRGLERERMFSDLAVALFQAGRVREAIAAMDTAVEASPSPHYVRSRVKLVVLWMHEDPLRACEEAHLALGACDTSEAKLACLNACARAMDGHLRPGMCTEEKLRVREDWFRLQLQGHEHPSMRSVKDTMELVWRAYKVDPVQGADICIRLHLCVCECVPDPQARVVVADVYASLGALAQVKTRVRTWVGMMVESVSASKGRDKKLATFIAGLSPHSRGILLSRLCQDLGLGLSAVPVTHFRHP